LALKPLKPTKGSDNMPDLTFICGRCGEEIDAVENYNGFCVECALLNAEDEAREWAKKYCRLEGECTELCVSCEWYMANHAGMCGSCDMLGANCCKGCGGPASKYFKFSDESGKEKV